MNQRSTLKPPKAFRPALTFSEPHSLTSNSFFQPNHLIAHNRSWMLFTTYLFSSILHSWTKPLRLYRCELSSLSWRFLIYPCNEVSAMRSYLITAVNKFPMNEMMRKNGERYEWIFTANCRFFHGFTDISMNCHLRVTFNSFTRGWFLSRIWHHTCIPTWWFWSNFWSHSVTHLLRHILYCL